MQDLAHKLPEKPSGIYCIRAGEFTVVMARASRSLDFSARYPLHEAIDQGFHSNPWLAQSWGLRFSAIA
jgi:hypothetical protein